MDTDDSGITQEQFDRVLNGEADDDATEEEDKEESEEAEGTEEESSAKDDAEEDDDKEESEEEEPPKDQEEELDWSKVDPRFKTAFEKTVQEQKRWQKGYSKFQSRLAKMSQASKEQDSALAALREKAENFERLSAFFEQNPDAAKALEAKLNGNRALEDNIPDYLKNDPAYKYIQERISPYLSQLEQKLSKFENEAKSWREIQNERANEKATRELDSHLDKAKTLIKSNLGRDASEDDMYDILEWMTENKIYRGDLAVAALYQEEIVKHKMDSYQNSLREKSKKFGTRNKTVNSKMGKEKSGHLDLEESIALALAEMGAE